jgi:arginase family enzyme
MTIIGNYKLEWLRDDELGLKVAQVFNILIWRFADFIFVGFDVLELVVILSEGDITGRREFIH